MFIAGKTALPISTTIYCAMCTDACWFTHGRGELGPAMQSQLYYFFRVRCPEMVARPHYRPRGAPAVKA
jgi:hypothetical protein